MAELNEDATRPIEMIWSDELESLRRDAERYRKIRDAGNESQFGEYVVVQTDKLRAGTLCFTGKRLDAAIDAMEAADGKP